MNQYNKTLCCRKNCRNFIVFLKVHPADYYAKNLIPYSRYGDLNQRTKILGVKVKTFKMHIENTICVSLWQPRNKDSESQLGSVGYCLIT